jgi:hypothetical protein
LRHDCLLFGLLALKKHMTLSGPLERMLALESERCDKPRPTHSSGVEGTLLPRRSWTVIDREVWSAAQTAGLRPFSDLPLLLSNILRKLLARPSLTYFVQFDVNL